MSLSDKKVGREIPYEIDKYCYYETDVKDAVKELIKEIEVRIASPASYTFDLVVSGTITERHRIISLIKDIFGEKLT